MAGQLVEDYGERVLLLHFVTGYQLPYHVVLEFVPGDEFATVVTAYIPDAKLWETDWKTRKRNRSRKRP